VSPTANIRELSEATADTFVREVREEAGLEVEPVRLTGLYTEPSMQNMTYPHGDQVQVVNVIFERRGLGGQIRLDGTESLDVGYFPADALLPLRPAHRLRLTDALSQQREADFR
jgi:8-oxo-dGTP diphosphatase